MLVGFINQNFSKNFSRKQLLENSQKGDFCSFLDFQRASFLRFLQYKKEQKENIYLEYLLRNTFNINKETDENNFKLEYNGYNIVVDDLSESQVPSFLRYSLSYKAKINLLFKSDVNGQKKDFKVLLVEIPFISPRDTFIVGGFERVFVPQMIRTKGVHFSKVKNRHIATEEYEVYIRPEHGTNINFFTHTLTRRKGSGVFCVVNNVRTPWYVLPTVLFFNNMHELLSSMFPIKETIIKHDCSNADDFAKFMINHDITKFMALDALSTFYNESSTNYLSKSLKSLYAEREVSFRHYDVPSEYAFLFENIDMKFFTTEESANQLYSKMRGAVILEDPIMFVRRLFLDKKYFSFGDVGQYVSNQKLNLNENGYVLTLSTVYSVIKYLMNLKNGLPECQTDDESSLSHRFVKGIGDVLYTEFRSILIGITQQLSDRVELALNKRQKNVKWISSLVQDCINSTNIQRRINALFAQNACSQFLDQLNPLSELLHKSKVMSTGEEGISKDFASFDSRNLHPSFYGRLCCLSTPEGPGVGLVNFFTLYAKINDMGFVCAPYLQVKDCKVDTKRIFYLDALTESLLRPKIAQSTTPMVNNEILQTQVLCRVGEDLLFVPNTEVEFIELHNNQFVSISASLIPFLEHNDNTRANMAANMQRQALPLLFPDKPLVQTGIEKLVVQQSKYALYAKEDGEVVYADNKRVEIQSGERKVVYHLQHFERSNQNTALGHRLYVRNGQKVKKGDILADSLASKDGVLSLGSNLLVAIMPFYGWNFEDAVVVSERCVRDNLLTSLSVNEYVTYIKKNKKGEEKMTKNLPFVKTHEISHLDDDGIVKVGSFVRSNDILVGKLTPRASSPLSRTDEKVLRAIFGDKFLDFQNTSLRLPPNSEGIVIDVEKYIPDSSTNILQETLQVVKVYVARRAQIEVGDKICGRYGNKTVISKILPECDMPFLKDGRRVDMVINPLGITSRMNIGQIMEMNCTLASQETTFAGTYCGLNTDAISQKLSDANLSNDGKVELFDGISGEKFEKTAVCGYMYTLKLEHMVNLKFHARSIGPYSLLTQQPVGGKVRFGGQRCGEMELWSLESYGAATTILEKTTVLSDDHENKQILLRNIMYGKNDFNFGVSNTFQVLLHHLNALLLDVTPMKLNDVSEEKDEA